jgi:hypothetical protein
MENNSFNRHKRRKHNPVHGGEGNKAAGEVLKDIGNKVLFAGVNALTGGAAGMSAGLDARRAREDAMLQGKADERGRLIEEEKRKAGQYIDNATGHNDFLGNGELPAGADTAAKAAESGKAALENAAATAGSAARAATGTELAAEGGSAPETEAHTEAVRKVINGGGAFTAATLDKVPGNAANAEWHRVLGKGGEIDTKTFLDANNVLNILAKSGKPMPLEDILENLKDPEAGAALLEKAMKIRDGQPENERYAMRTVRDFAEPEEAASAGPEAPPEPEAPPQAGIPAEGVPFRRDLNGARSVGMYGGATNAQVAAAQAGLRLYGIQKQRQEYEGALGVKLDNMAFDLKTQGTQLAASIQNMTPEKQRTELLKWQDKINQDPAYSPFDKNISPQEREARARVVNGVMQSVIGQVQSNSLERQRSQELADMQTKTDGIVADVSGGRYNSRPEEAYADGLRAVEAAARHLSPQQYNSAVTGLYEGVTSELYGAVMGEVLKRAGGEPITGAEELGVIMKKVDGLARVGAGYLSGALGNEAGKVLLAKAAGFAAGAKKQVADYNTGLLESYNREYNMYVEADDPRAADTAALWRENRQKMINAGTITGEQAYKTRNYFGTAEKTGEGNGGAASAAKAEITGLQEFMVTGGAAGTSPAEALELTAQKILKTQTNRDGSPLTGWQARDLAVYHLADQWIHSNSFRDGDAVKQAYLNLTQNLDDLIKAEGIDGDTAYRLTNDAYHVFWNGLFNMSPDSTVREIKEHAGKIAADFYNAMSPVFNDNNHIDEDVLVNRFDPKNLKEVAGNIFDAAGRMGIDPDMLAKSEMSGGTYNAVIKTLKTQARSWVRQEYGDIFKGMTPEKAENAIQIKPDTDNGRFMVSVEVPYPLATGRFATRKKLFNAEFDRKGRLVFSDADYEGNSYVPYHTLAGNGVWETPGSRDMKKREEETKKLATQRRAREFIEKKRTGSEEF